MPVTAMQSTPLSRSVLNTSVLRGSSSTVVPPSKMLDWIVK